MQQLLGELERGVQKSCVAMMREALPFALETAVEDRHDFQQKLLKAFLEVIAEETARREKAIAQAESAVREHEEQVGSHQDQLQAAQAEAETRREAKEKAEAGMHDAQTAADAAAGGVREEERKVADLEAKAAKLATDKEEFDGFKELYPRLRDGLWEKKDWRGRQKAIKQVAAYLSSAPAPPSLVASLPLALKDPPAARGSFATKVVEEGERELSTFSTSLAEAITEAKEAAERARGTDVERAEAAKKEAEEALGAAQESVIVASNAWVEAEDRSSSLKRKRLEEEGGDLQSQLADAKAALELLRAAVAAVGPAAGAPEPAAQGAAPAEAAPAAAEAQAAA